ncbi:MAG: hypothetical protein ACOYOP_08130 [Microthrixaceae bacterium]
MAKRAPAGDGPIDLDAVVAAAGDLTLEHDGSFQVLTVPMPGRHFAVRVNLRGTNDGVVLDDGGVTLRHLGRAGADAVRRLAEAGEAVALDTGTVCWGPVPVADAPAAALRFAFTLGLLPTAARVATTAIAEAGVGAAGAHLDVTELWADEQGEWDIEHLRDSAREFQEDQLRRWAG